MSSSQARCLHAVASNGNDWLQADDQFEQYKV